MYQTQQRVPRQWDKQTRPSGRRLAEPCGRQKSESTGWSGLEQRDWAEESEGSGRTAGLLQPGSVPLESGSTGTMFDVQWSPHKCWPFFLLLTLEKHAGYFYAKETYFLFYLLEAEACK